MLCREHQNQLALLEAELKRSCSEFAQTENLDCSVRNSEACRRGGAKPPQACYENCKDISTQRLPFQFFFQRHFESRCLKLASSLQLGIILIQSNLCTRRHHADAVGQRPQLGFQSTGLSELFKSNWLGLTKEVLLATLHPLCEVCCSRLRCKHQDPMQSH